MTVWSRCRQVCCYARYISSQFCPLQFYLLSWRYTSHTESFFPCQFSEAGAISNQSQVRIFTIQTHKEVHSDFKQQARNVLQSTTSEQSQVCFSRLDLILTAIKVGQQNIGHCDSLEQLLPLLLQSSQSDLSQNIDRADMCKEGEEAGECQERTPTSSW